MDKSYTPRLEHKNPDTPTTGCSSSGRVLRGGSWLDFPTILRSAYRYGISPDYRIIDFGLRLARTP